MNFSLSFALLISVLSLLGNLSSGSSFSRIISGISVGISLIPFTTDLLYFVKVRKNRMKILKTNFYDFIFSSNSSFNKSKRMVDCENIFCNQTTEEETTSLPLSLLWFGSKPNNDGDCEWHGETLADKILDYIDSIEYLGVKYVVADEININKSKISNMLDNDDAIINFKTYEHRVNMLKFQFNKKLTILNIVHRKSNVGRSYTLEGIPLNKIIMIKTIYSWWSENENSAPVNYMLKVDSIINVNAMTLKDLLKLKPADLNGYILKPKLSISIHGILELKLSIGETAAVLVNKYILDKYKQNYEDLSKFVCKFGGSSKILSSSQMKRFIADVSEILKSCKLMPLNGLDERVLPRKRLDDYLANLDEPEHCLHSTIKISKFSIKNVKEEVSKNAEFVSVTRKVDSIKRSIEKQTASDKEFYRETLVDKLRVHKMRLKQIKDKIKRKKVFDPLIGFDKNADFPPLKSKYIDGDMEEIGNMELDNKWKRSLMSYKEVLKKGLKRSSEFALLKEVEEDIEKLFKGKLPNMSQNKILNSYKRKPIKFVEGEDNIFINDLEIYKLDKVNIFNRFHILGEEIIKGIDFFEPLKNVVNDCLEVCLERDPKSFCRKIRNYYDEKKAKAIKNKIKSGKKRRKTNVSAANAHKSCFKNENGVKDSDDFFFLNKCLTLIEKTKNNYGFLKDRVYFRGLKFKHLNNIRNELLSNDNKNKYMSIQEETDFKNKFIVNLYNSVITMDQVAESYVPYKKQEKTKTKRRHTGGYMSEYDIVPED